MQTHENIFIVVKLLEEKHLVVLFQGCQEIETEKGRTLF